MLVISFLVISLYLPELKYFFNFDTDKKEYSLALLAAI